MRTRRLLVLLTGLGWLGAGLLSSLVTVGPVETVSRVFAVGVLTTVTAPMSALGLAAPTASPSLGHAVFVLFGLLHVAFVARPYLPLPAAAPDDWERENL